MKTPTYIDCAPGQVPEGADFVEIKFDGVYAQINVHKGDTECVAVGKSGKPVGAVKLQAPSPCGIVILGEMMVKTERSKRARSPFIAFDVCEAGPLSHRTRSLEAWCRATGVNFVVRNGLAHWQAMWSYYVQTGNEEGLIFRRECEPWDGRIWRMKAVQTADYAVIGVEIKERAVIVGVGVSSGAQQRFVVDTGTVMAADIGRIFEAQGNGFTANGCLRHGQFRRWRGIGE